MHLFPPDVLFGSVCDDFLLQKLPESCVCIGDLESGTREENIVHLLGGSGSSVKIHVSSQLLRNNS